MIKRDLNQIKYIPYNDNFTLTQYTENFDNTLNEKVFEIQCETETINLIFLERHLPHIIGLHHYIDKNSNNKLLRKKHNLLGQDGFDNMIEGDITLLDLKEARNGTIWKAKRNRKRLLSMHLIPDMIRESSLYLVDGKLKGKIKAKYILKSNLTNTMYALCLEEDIKLNILGKNYCCMSNLIDDNLIRKKIDNNELKQINIKRIIKKDFYSGHILEVTHKKISIPIGNRNVCSSEVSVACVGQLLLKDFNFSSVFVPERGRHMIFYLYFDTQIIRFLNRIDK